MYKRFAVLTIVSYRVTTVVLAVELSTFRKSLLLLSIALLRLPSVLVLRFPTPVCTQFSVVLVVDGEFQRADFGGALSCHGVVRNQLLHTVQG